MAKSPKPPLVNHALIHELTKLLDETGLTEIEIEQDGLRVRVARGTLAAGGARQPAPLRRTAAAVAVRRRRRSIPPSIPAR